HALPMDGAVWALPNRWSMHTTWKMDKGQLQAIKKTDNPSLTQVQDIRKLAQLHRHLQRDTGKQVFPTCMPIESLVFMLPLSFIRVYGSINQKAKKKCS